MRLVERRDIGDADAAFVAVSAVAAQGAKDLLHGRHADDAGDQFALVFEADERGPDRDAADEAAGAVDRVDDPAIAGGAGRVAEFLAEEAVVGEFAEQDFAHQIFGAAVGHGDGALVRLPFDGDALIEVFQRELPRLLGGVQGGVVAIAPVGVHG